MFRLILLLSVAMSVFPALAQDNLGCSNSVVLNGGTIEVYAADGGDTENIQCALDAAVSGGFRDVFLVLVRKLPRLLLLPLLALVLSRHVLLPSLLLLVKPSLRLVKPPSSPVSSLCFRASTRLLPFKPGVLVLSPTSSKAFFRLATVFSCSTSLGVNIPTRGV